MKQKNKKEKEYVFEDHIATCITFGFYRNEKTSINEFALNLLKKKRKKRREHMQVYKEQTKDKRKKKNTMVILNCIYFFLTR